MLRTETVERTTFELLKTLMQDEKLKSFNLVGGTALALFIGHRKSIDLDLFSLNTFNKVALEKHLYDMYNFKNQYPKQKTNIILIGEIQKVKVDFVWDDSVLINPLCFYDGIRICSIHDIAAMKLKAILQNGTRLKDFVDVAFLSVKMSLKNMLDTFETKYPSTGKLLAAKALTYFDDIDFSVNIELIEGKFNWKAIEKRLIEMIKYPDKKFLNYPLI